jgi:hypothetical protein
MNGPEKFLWLYMLLVPGELLAQDSFGVFGGLGTYQMDNLKEVNKMKARSLPFKTVGVDNFNPGFYFGTSASFELSENFVLGLNYQYTSTGSRIGQKDYSGYYRYDQIVNGHLIGIEPERIIEENNFITISFSFLTGVIFTGLKMKEKLTVYGENQESSESFAAISIPFYPAVKLSVPVTTFISGTISLGYLYDSGGKVHLKGNKDAVIGINNSPLKTGWNGFRITAGVKFKFNNSKTDSS